MRSTAFSILLFALAACGSEPVSQPVAAAPTKPKAATTVAAPAASADAEGVVHEYAYSPVGKRDPFRSPLDEIVAHSAEAVENVKCGPLCRWELEQLKLVAVISGVSNPMAMVEDPQGKGYIVRRGTFIGKRNGKVSQIRSGEVIVTEVFKDQMGKPHLNQISIALPRDENSQTEDQNLLGAEVMQ